MRQKSVGLLDTAIKSY